MGQPQECELLCCLGEFASESPTEGLVYGRVGRRMGCRRLVGERRIQRRAVPSLGAVW